jgi:hypothetical protein
MPLTYLDHTFLPASTPQDHAHVLINDSNDENNQDGLLTINHKLCDFIATVLDRLEEYPNALKDFFNPNVKSFKLIRHYGDDESGQVLPLMIWRKKKKVVVSVDQ